MNLRSTMLSLDTDRRVRVEWGSATSGDVGVSQKLSVNLLTRVGSNAVAPTRGTYIEKALLQGQGYSARSLQHLLNFAALDVRNAVQPVLVGEGEKYPDDHVKKVGIELVGVYNMRVQAVMRFETFAGRTVEQTTTL